MGLGWFVIAAGAAGGCYYGYRKLQQVEEEIREELQAKGLMAEQQVAVPGKQTKPVSSKSVPPIKKAEAKAVRGSLEERILAEVKASPGMLQTELYKCFPDSERKALQAALLKMDKAGTLKRSKEKSTYRLDLM